MGMSQILASSGYYKIKHFDNLRSREKSDSNWPFNIIEVEHFLMRGVVFLL